MSDHLQSQITGSDDALASDHSEKAFKDSVIASYFLF